jgi:hypothetical protein
MSSSGCSEWTASSIVAWRSPTSERRAGILGKHRFGTVNL